MFRRLSFVLTVLILAGPALAQDRNKEMALKKAAEALATAEKAYGDAPADAKVKLCKPLAAAHAQIGLIYLDLNKVQEAEEAFRRAIVLQEQGIVADPKDAELRYDLAGVHNGLGQTFVKTGKMKEGEATYQKALAMREKLVADFPKVATYRHGLAQTRLNLAELNRITGRLAESEQGYRNAAAVLEKLVEESPKEPPYLRDLAKGYYGLVLILKQSGKQEESDAMLGKLKATQATLEKLTKPSK